MIRAEQSRAKHGEPDRSGAEPERSRAKQSSAAQRRAEQSRAERSAREEARAPGSADRHDRSENHSSGPQRTRSGQPVSCWGGGAGAHGPVHTPVATIMDSVVVRVVAPLFMMLLLWAVV